MKLLERGQYRQEQKIFFHLWVDFKRKLVEYSKVDSKAILSDFGTPKFWKKFAKKISCSDSSNATTWFLFCFILQHRKMVQPVGHHFVCILNLLILNFHFHFICGLLDTIRSPLEHYGIFYQNIPFWEWQWSWWLSSFDLQNLFLFRDIDALPNLNRLTSELSNKHT